MKRYFTKTASENGLRFICGVSSAIILPLLTMPTLIIIFLLTLPYKLIVYICVKLFSSKDVIGFVHGLNGYLAVDKIHTRPTFALNYFLVLDGVIPLERFQSIFQERIINKKSTDHSDEHFVYGRFRQYWYNFMGYNFWKWDNNFDLKNHIKLYSDSDKEANQKGVIIKETDVVNASALCSHVYTRQDLPALMGQQIPKPFPKNQSPWEILLLYNYQDSADKLEELPASKMVIIFRIHHTLADGYSLLRVLQYDLPLRTKPLVIAQPVYVTQPFWKIILKCFLVGYELCKFYTETYDPKNEWIFSPRAKSNLEPVISSSGSGSETSGKYLSSITRPIQVSKIRAIKNKFGVSYVAVLMTIVCEGIRRAMLEAGQGVPGRIGFFFTKPKSNHPQGLVNHVYCSMAVFPTGPMNIVSRLRLVERELKKDKKSIVPPILFLLNNFVALLPSCFLSLHIKVMPPCFSFSNFPVPEEPTSIDGCEVSDFFVGLGTAFADRGGVIMMFGDGGKQSIVVSCDQASYSSQDSFEKLGLYIGNALDVLESTVSSPW